MTYGYRAAQTGKNGSWLPAQVRTWGLAGGLWLAGGGWLPATAQEIDKLGQQAGAALKALKPANLLKDNSIKLTGSVTGRYVAYQAWGPPAGGIESRRVPVNYLLTGNVNLSVFGKVNVPLTFSFANQTTSFNLGNPFAGLQAPRLRLPFNRFVFKPAYKGFTLHTGAGCALTFSPYTLSGHRFDGLGLTYKGKAPVYGGLMYGVFNPAVRIDTSGGRLINNRPSYRRVGVGGQLGYRHGKDLMEVILFQASDQLASLPYSLDSLRIAPLQNAVASLKGAKALGSQWHLQAEVAVSGLSTDTRAEPGTRRRTGLTTFGGLLTPNATTTYKTALHAALEYQEKTFTAGLDYARIEPGYRTLGAYFFTNDLETIALKGATQLLDGKLALTTDLGLQQDDLAGTKLQRLRQLVGALNAVWVPTEKTNLSLAYSTFRSATNLRSQFDYLTQVAPFDALDTLDYRQINQNLLLALTTTLPAPNPDISRTLSANLVMQGGSSAQGSQQTATRLLNATLGYQATHTARHLSWSAGLNAGLNQAAGLAETLLGPSLSGAKSWFDQALKSSLSATYSYALTPGQPPLRVLSVRAGLVGSLAKKHHLLLDAGLLHRPDSGRTDRFRPAFTELTLTLGYAYNFQATFVK